MHNSDQLESLEIKAMNYQLLLDLYSDAFFKKYHSKLLRTNLFQACNDFKQTLDSLTVLALQFSTDLQRVSLFNLSNFMKKFVQSQLSLLSVMIKQMFQPCQLLSTGTQLQQIDLFYQATKTLKKEPTFTSSKGDFLYSQIPWEDFTARRQFASQLNTSNAVNFMGEINKVLKENSSYLTQLIQISKCQIKEQSKITSSKDSFKSIQTIITYIIEKVEESLRKGSGKFIIKLFNNVFQQKKLQNTRTASTQTKFVKEFTRNFIAEEFSDDEEKKNYAEKLKAINNEYQVLDEKYRMSAEISQRMEQQVIAVKLQLHEKTTKYEEKIEQLEKSLEEALELDIKKTIRFNTVEKTMKREWAEEVSSLNSKFQRQTIKLMQEKEEQIWKLRQNLSTALSLLNKATASKQIQTEQPPAAKEKQPNRLAQPSQTGKHKEKSIHLEVQSPEQTQSKADTKNFRPVKKDAPSNLNRDISLKNSQCNDTNNDDNFTEACLRLEQATSLDQKSKQMAVKIIKILFSKPTLQHNQLVKSIGQIISLQKIQSQVECKENHEFQIPISPLLIQARLSSNPRSPKPLASRLINNVFLQKQETRGTSRKVFTRNNEDIKSSQKTKRLPQFCSTKTLSLSAMTNFKLIFINFQQARSFQKMPFAKDMFLQRPPFKISKSLRMYTSAHEEKDSKDSLSCKVYKFLQYLRFLQPQEYRHLSNFMYRPHTYMTSGASQLEDGILFSFKGVKKIIDRLRILHSQLCGDCNHVQAYWQSLSLSEQLEAHVQTMKAYQLLQ